ncbi:hypothetical protein OEIGOIKO_05756 [Streptomyces chrestomyceticus JCM 4735]|uniref:Uncharacterized protein n=1 Tax=Streptomyces chrestomyceticus JCM 4735 TaxID=1306181 RepID=A0A7U9KYX0_9ACTN|nr:hypothetical protein [Streptomyces chrestomyceticus]GCD37946.1 hypothetical protein OEIGOIKO_05756 [Streptomyces chrestomyceticus JCM 4735]
MRYTRHVWLNAAPGVSWFRLDRHDDPEPEEPSPDDPVAPEAEDEPGSDDDREPEGADQLGDAGKKALDKLRAELKAERTRHKRESAAAQKRIQEFEDRDKSELDKATSKAEQAMERAERATTRAVLAEVKAAASDFADPEDAAVYLDPSAYTDDDGDIDTAAIAADLEALLERKPHLRRPAAEPEKKTPKPDPAQGSRQAAPATDFRTADRAELEAELAKSVPGFRLRT